MNKKTMEAVKNFKKAIPISSPIKKRRIEQEIPSSRKKRLTVLAWNLVSLATDKPLDYDLIVIKTNIYIL